MAHNEATASSAAAAPLHAPALVAELERLPERYPQRRGALLPILTRLQEERGHLTTDDLELAAKITGLSPGEVFSVTSFYTMYRLEQKGRHPVGICRNIACWLRGAEALVDALEGELGIHVGETTADRQFSLEELECLGSCGTAPALEIDGRYFERLDPAQGCDLIRKLKDGADLEELYRERREGGAS